ncbi:MAG: PilZ domain-containing protein [Fimbriimonadaceae bacterium]|nr:PilZ domain-containing protein [Fimbriimonadaceae bacterium]
MLVRFQTRPRIFVGSEVDLEFELVPGEPMRATGKMISLYGNEAQIWLVHRQIQEIVIREPRYPVKDWPAMVTLDCQDIPVRLTDVSMRGVSFDTPVGAEVGKELPLTLWFGSHEFAVNVKVIWSHQRLYGTAMACGAKVLPCENDVRQRWISFVEFQRALL